MTEEERQEALEMLKSVKEGLDTIKKENEFAGKMLLFLGGAFTGFIITYIFMCIFH